MVRNLICVVMSLLCLGALVSANNSSVVAETKDLVSSQAIDEISLKQQEMRDTTVLVQTSGGSGSGTIIDCNEVEPEGTFEYRVLTNAHVTYSRFSDILSGADSLTGDIELETIDTGSMILVFNHQHQCVRWHEAEVVGEDIQYDLAMLTFRSQEPLSIAKVATDEMLQEVRVFDDIFAIGCQLGNAPSPTTGIISAVLRGDNGVKEWIIYANTSQIMPGSSGGGLFKKINGHYRLIGIPFRVAVAPNGQLVPHLAHAISVATAREFIDEHLVSCP